MNPTDSPVNQRVQARNPLRWGMFQRASLSNPVWRIRHIVTDRLRGGSVPTLDDARIHMGIPLNLYGVCIH